MFVEGSQRTESAFSSHVITFRTFTCFSYVETRFGDEVEGYLCFSVMLIRLWGVDGAQEGFAARGSDYPQLLAVP
jgi:hypothetical protein